MYSLGFSYRREVPLASFFCRLSSPCILPVHCGGYGYFLYLLFYILCYHKKKKKNNS